MIKKYMLLLVLSHMAAAEMHAQGETAADPILAVFGTDNFRCIDNFSNTSCAPNSLVYDLGEEPATGPLSNDTWFQFTAPAGVVKIRVCSPSFNAAVEVYDQSNNLLQTIDNSTLSGAPGKEVGCVTGLAYGAVYLVRVGRSTGTGVGTFILNLEHSAVQLLPTATPGPNGSACYGPTDTLIRTASCSPNVLTTYWKVVDETGSEIITSSTGETLMLSNLTLCTDANYTIYCEVIGVDLECGNIHFGYAVGVPVTLCADACPIVTQPADGDTLCANGYNFELGSVNSGQQYQWMIESEDGSVQFISTINANGLWYMGSSAYVENFVYGETYHVYNRTWVCYEAPGPAWCDSGVSFLICDAPEVGITSSARCKWHSVSDGVLVFNTVNDSPWAEYRVRLIPVSTCSRSSIDNAWLGQWQTDAFLELSNTAVIPGVEYAIEVESRIVEHPCIGCIGAATTIVGSSLGWGPRYYFGAAAPSDPLMGAALECGCNP